MTDSPSKHRRDKEKMAYSQFLKTLWDIAFEAMLRAIVKAYSPVPWFLDPMQSVTRSYPLISKGFHVRNLYGRMFQNYIVREIQCP